jgi:hypothetical protein
METRVKYILVLIIALFSIIAFAQQAPKKVATISSLLASQKPVISNLTMDSTPPSGGNYSFEISGRDGNTVSSSVGTESGRPGRAVYWLGFNLEGAFTKQSYLAWVNMQAVLIKPCLTMTDKDYKPLRAFVIDSMQQILKLGQGKYKKSFGAFQVEVKASFFTNGTADLFVSVYRGQAQGWNTYCVDDPSIGLVPKGASEDVGYVALRDLSSYPYEKIASVIKDAEGFYILELNGLKTKFKVAEKQVVDLQANKTFRLDYPAFNHDGVIYIHAAILKSFHKCQYALPTDEEFENASYPNFSTEFKCGDVEFDLDLWVW